MNLLDMMKQLKDIRNEKNLLDKKDKELSKRLISKMEKMGIEEKQSKHFGTCKLIETKRLTIDPYLYDKHPIITHDKLLASVSVSITQAKRFLTEVELEKIGKINISKNIRFS